MSIRKRTLLIILFSILLLTELIFLIGSRYFNLLTLSKYKKMSQEEFESEKSYTVFGYMDHYSEDLLKLLIKYFPVSWVNKFSYEEAEQIREQLLNISCRKTEKNKVYFSNNPFELFEYLKNGEYLSCGEISKLYGNVLTALGFKCRLTTVTRSIFDSWDKHTFIEIWDETRRKWIISDPTFNVTFKNNEQYLSSIELYDLIHKGYFDSIKVEKGNQTKFEIPLEELYISYFSYFDNILYIPYNNHLELTSLPPLRWFNDKHTMFLVQSKTFPNKSSSYMIQDLLMFFILLFNPVLIFISLAVIIYIFYRKYRKGKSSFCMIPKF